MMTLLHTAAIMASGPALLLALAVLVPRRGNYCQHGEDAYSYQTCIRTTNANGRPIYNATKYSRTTSRHQSACFGREVDSPGAIVLRNVPRGATADELRAQALEEAGPL